MAEGTHEMIPCPFCAGARWTGSGIVAAYVDGIVPDLENGYLNISIANNGWYWVTCNGCKTTGPRVKGPVDWTRNLDATRKAINRAIDAWNERPNIQTSLEL